MQPGGAAGRVRIEGGPEGLLIVIPPRRNLFTLLFLGVWLLGWAMGELTTLEELLAGRAKDPPQLVAVWLLVWTLGGAIALYTWLWMLAGAERIRMGTAELTVKRDILGLGWGRTYRLSAIRGLRIAPMPLGPYDGKTALRLAGLAGGVIAFEYEGKCIRFGGSLDAAEAQLVVERISQRFAFAALPVAPPEGR
jgi:hypothetical protein